MQNMGAELPVERICQPKPCLCTTHQIWGVCASTGAHGKSVKLGVRPPYFGAELVFGHIHYYTGTTSGTTLLKKFVLHENQIFDHKFFGNRKNTFETNFKNCNMYGTCMLLVDEHVVFMG